MKKKNPKHSECLFCFFITLTIPPPCSQNETARPLMHLLIPSEMLTTKGLYFIHHGRGCDLQKGSIIYWTSNIKRARAQEREKMCCHREQLHRAACVYVWHGANGASYMYDERMSQEQPVASHEPSYKKYTYNLAKPVWKLTEGTIKKKKANDFKFIRLLWVRHLASLNIGTDKKSSVDTVMDQTDNYRPTSTVSIKLSKQSLTKQIRNKEA